MIDGEDSGIEADRGRIALGLCERFRDFPGSHIAPAIPQRTIHSALQGFLDLREDETLLAIVGGRDDGRPGTGFALTTRRIYWLERAPLRRSIGVARGPRDGPRNGRSLAYEDLPDSIVGSAKAVELGEGRRVAVGGDPALADELTRFLRAMRSLARGEEGLLGLQRGWLGPTWADVLMFSEGVRAYQAERRAFDQQLYRTDRVVVTPVLVAACVGIFGAMVASGASPTDPTPETMDDWGAIFGPLVAIDGQYWRLFSAMFLHIGAIHLIFNMWCLIAGGRVIERFFGGAGFAALYVLSGVGGSIASLYAHPLTTSAGASGAIFGIYGGLLGFLAVQRNVPRASLKPLRSGVLGLLCYNLILGFAVPNVDIAAHLGGLVTGFLVGLAMTIASPTKATRFAALRRLAVVAAFAVVLGLLAQRTIVVARERILADPNLGPIARKEPDLATTWNAFSASLEPLLEEFTAVGAGINVLVGDFNGHKITPVVLLPRIDELLSRLHLLGERIRLVPASDDELRAIRDRLDLSRVHQEKALEALKRFLQTGVETNIRGAEGFSPSFAASQDDLREFGRLRDLYFKTHGLTRKEP
jgi:rhomboid protease GluP